MDFHVLEFMSLIKTVQLLLLRNISLNSFRSLWSWLGRRKTETDMVIDLTADLSLSKKMVPWWTSSNKNSEGINVTFRLINVWPLLWSYRNDSCSYSSILNACWKTFKCGNPTDSRQVQEIAPDFRHFNQFMNNRISWLMLKVAI